jgi:hypothetical protein
LFREHHWAEIAIEPALGTVKDYLISQGYDVQNISSNNLNEFSAIVVTGLNTNLSEFQDTGTKAVVINADGLTPSEVEQRLTQINNL